MNYIFSFWGLNREFEKNHRYVKKTFAFLYHFTHICDCNSFVIKL